MHITKQILSMKKQLLFVLALILCASIHAAQTLNNPIGSDGCYIVKWDCSTNSFAASNDFEADESFTFAVDITGTSWVNWLAGNSNRGICTNFSLSSDGAQNIARDGDRLFHITGNIYGKTINIAQLEEIDSQMAVADRRHVQRLNGWAGDEVSAIEIRTAPGTSVEKMSARVEDLVFLNAQEDDRALFVTNVKALYGHLFDWLALLDSNVLMILALMIVVAGFNMISAILIILFEKISTIGLLKALGMTSREVSKVFLLRAGALAAAVAQQKAQRLPGKVKRAFKHLVKR